MYVELNLLLLVWFQLNGVSFGLVFSKPMFSLFLRLPERGVIYKQDLSGHFKSNETDFVGILKKKTKIIIK